MFIVLCCTVLEFAECPFLRVYVFSAYDVVSLCAWIFRVWSCIMSLLVVSVSVCIGVWVALFFDRLFVTVLVFS